MSACQPFEDQLLLHASEGRMDSSWSTHLASCATCRARLEHERRLILALRELEAKSAPEGLAELVTAELDADGHGLRAGRLLGRMADLGAPLELDALVERSLTDEVAGERAGRHLAFLENQPVPDALEGRVVAALHAGHREDRASEQVASLTPLRAPGHASPVPIEDLPNDAHVPSAPVANTGRLLRFGAPLAAAAVVLFVFGQQWLQRAGADRTEASRYSFRIIERDVSENPRAAGLLNGIGGIRVEGEAR